MQLLVSEEEYTTTIIKFNQAHLLLDFGLLNYTSSSKCDHIHDPGAVLHKATGIDISSPQVLHWTLLSLYLLKADQT